MSQVTEQTSPDNQANGGFGQQLKVLIAVLGGFLMLAVIVSSMPKDKGAERQKTEKAESELKAAVVIFDARLNKLDLELDQFIAADQESKNPDESNARMAKYLKMNEKTQRVMADMLRFFEEFLEKNPNINESLLREHWTPLVTKIEEIEKRQNAVHSNVQEDSKKAENDLLKGIKKGEK